MTIINMKNESKSIPRNLTYEQVYDFALEVFYNDKDKRDAWWMSRCEEFGGLSPYLMVKNGKGRRVMRLLEKCK
jgi:hypothetical protein